MIHLHGVQVILLARAQTDTDSLGRPVYTTEPVIIDNVLVGQPSTEDITSSTNLSGHKIHYVLGLPKGDDHTWDNTDVILPTPWSCKCRVVGAPIEGIESNIPLLWNRKVLLERYE